MGKEKEKIAPRRPFDSPGIPLRNAVFNPSTLCARCMLRCLIDGTPRAVDVVFGYLWSLDIRKRKLTLEAMLRIDGQDILSNILLLAEVGIDTCDRMLEELRRLKLPDEMLWPCAKT